MLVSFKPRQGILKNLSMFRLNFDKFESISNLKKVNVFQDKTLYRLDAPNSCPDVLFHRP